jgi:hypothetical protein
VLQILRDSHIFAEVKTLGHEWFSLQNKAGTHASWKVYALYIDVNVKIIQPDSNGLGLLNPNA